VRQKNNARDKNGHGHEDEEESPCLISIRLVIEYERVEETTNSINQLSWQDKSPGFNLPSCSVNAIEDRYNQSGVVDPKTTIQADNLGDSSDSEEYDGEYGCRMPKLVASILMR